MQKAARIYSLKSWVIPLLFLFCAVPSLYAVDVTLEWARNPESDVRGYRIYYGTTSRHSPGSPPYSRSIDVGNVTTYTVTGLGTGIYYFAVTAYNAAGLESGFSNEVSNRSPCDLNGDGIVDIYDLRLLGNSLSNPSACPSCDLNVDGLVDLLDLRFLADVIRGARVCR